MDATDRAGGSPPQPLAAGCTAAVFFGIGGALLGLLWEVALTGDVSWIGPLAGAASFIVLGALPTLTAVASPTYERQREMMFAVFAFWLVPAFLLLALAGFVVWAVRVFA